MAIRKRRSIFDVIDKYFDDMEEWAEQFERTLIERPSWNQKACTFEPLRDVIVSPAEVTVTVDLPLTEENTVQVTPVDDRTLEIKAKMKRTVRLQELGITHHRGEFHTFHCHICIPVSVQMDKMKTNFKKGILEIHVPRKQERVIATKKKRSLRQ